MAVRIVLLGWGAAALELDSPDAGAMIAAGICRVSLSKWGGPLADATVLMFRPEYLRAHGGESDETAHLQAFVRAKLLCPNASAFQVEVPIEVGR